MYRIDYVGKSSYETVPQPNLDPPGVLNIVPNRLRGAMGLSFLYQPEVGRDSKLFCYNRNRFGWIECD